MNTPYVKTYDSKGNIQFPKEGVVNHYPSNRGNRHSSKPKNNRKATRGRAKRTQWVINPRTGKLKSIVHNN